MTNNSSCTSTNNDMTFSSGDHLDWDQKKQDMILNLGLANNSETDQTPTPTRLIRNCEEVGLFQDLQIVNPFDEVFKKAVENGSSTSVQLPVSTSDDTLHTPQIYPQLEETLKVQSNTVFAPTEYSFSSVISSLDQSDDGDNPLVIALDQDKECKDIDIDDTSVTCEDKAKVSLETHIPQYEAEFPNNAGQETKSGGIIPVSIDKLLDPIRQNSSSKDQLFQMKIIERLRQREANNAAQSRCRKRKRKEFENMKEENKRLKDENTKLTTMNLYLQETIKKLEEELKEARSSNGEPSGPAIVLSENQPCVQKEISSTVDKINKKLPNQKFTCQVVSLPITEAVASSSEGTTLQTAPNSVRSALQNSILTNHITPPVLNKQANICSTLKTSLKPIAPKPDNSVGIPVVFVYPKSSTSIILPVKPLHILNSTEDSEVNKSNSKKIIPK